MHERKSDGRIIFRNSIVTVGRSTQELVIRSATAQDVRSMAKLHTESWKIAYEPILSQKQLDWASESREIRNIKKMLKEGLPIVLAEIDGQLAGFIIYDRIDDRMTDASSDFEIHSFWVDYRKTRQGIGTALVDEMIERCSPDRIYVWVLTGLTAGPAFYEKRHFIAEEDTRGEFVFLDEPLPVVRYVRKLT